MEPITFQPIFKQIRWGGRRLADVLNKEIGEGDDYAESWEISDHREGRSVAATGDHTGMSLTKLVREHGEELFGAQRNRFRHSAFPLLVKFLDAHDRLSVQVHPNDLQAKVFHPQENGKTEAWVVLESEGGVIWAGLKEGITRKEFEEALEAGTIEDCLHRVDVQAGQCILIPAGTVHAIGEGVLLAEIQQTSNITYRINDWGRTDANGVARPTHKAQAFSVIDWNRGPVNPVEPQLIVEGPPKTEKLVSCDKFEIYRHTSKTAFAIDPAGRFNVLIGVAGTATWKAGEATGEINKGQTVLIPGTASRVVITPTGNEDTIALTAFVP